jgi:imidazole glycerol-phosphate synthase subunit HisH
VTQTTAAGLMRSGGRPLRRSRVAIADYGAGNVRSVVSALRRAGADPEVTANADTVRGAPLALIAGVGHVERAARGLEAVGLAEAIRDRVEAGRPTLGICVGLQLLFEESEEGGGGLGLLPGRVVRLQTRLVPHMGWNQLCVTRPSAILGGLEGAYVYFAHSYAAKPTDATVVTAIARFGGEVVAAVEEGPLAGVQFHPERSAVAGARLLANALAWSRSA